MPISMHPLIPAAQLHERICELGKMISQDYKGQSLYVIGVLKGSFIFLADLVRQIDLDCQVEFIGVSSYEGTSSTGHVRISYDLASDIEDKHVLLVEDIIDTGTTIDYLVRTFQVRNPRSMRVACLLSKPSCHLASIAVDYTGFEIGPEFVVGYGLDLDGRYRQLPDIMQVISL